jgi:hypothetical protein
MTKTPIIFAAVAVLALGRVFITPRLTDIPSAEGSYEAIAHLVDGFLILVPFYDWHQTVGPSRLYGILGGVFALWELGWFIVQKFAL